MPLNKENSILVNDQVYKDALKINESIKKTNPKVASNLYLLGMCKVIVIANILTFIGFYEFSAIHLRVLVFKLYLSLLKQIVFYANFLCHNLIGVAFESAGYCPK